MRNLEHYEVVVVVMVVVGFLLLGLDQSILTTPTKVQTLSAPEDHRAQSCMSNGSSLRQLINSTRQVVVVMPAKASGSSMKQFSRSCNDASYNEMKDNFLNDPAALKNLLTKSWEMPGVISSHIYQPQTLVDIIINVPRDTLLIYSHRQETPRLQSAVKHVLQSRLCSNLPNAKKDIERYGIKRHGLQCNISEKNLTELIESGKNEIGISTNRLLTCDTFEAIENYAPTMIFMDYKQANQIQDIIAEKYCPQLLGKPVAVNVAAEKKMDVYVSTNNMSNVTLDNWLATKSSTLEFALRLNDKATCVAKTRIMEDKLYLCDGFLNVRELS